MRLRVYNEMECVVGDECLYLGMAVTHHVCARFGILGCRFLGVPSLFTGLRFFAEKMVRDADFGSAGVGAFP